MHDVARGMHRAGPARRRQATSVPSAMPCFSRAHHSGPRVVCARVRTPAPRVNDACRRIRTRLFWLVATVCGLARMHCTLTAVAHCAGAPNARRPLLPVADKARR